MCFVLSLFAILSTGNTTASAEPHPAKVGESSYVISDSIGYGLQLEGLETQLQAVLGGPSKINFDGGRSITTAGSQVKKSALDTIDADKALIAKAGVIVIILGMNQIESNFEESQVQLMQKFKAVAPHARYFWVDIGATIASQVPGWNQRNKIIYANANRLGYSVISRYKAIFGPTADPLNLSPGKNFPNWATEEGYGGPGNIHGYSADLAKAIVSSVTDRTARRTCAIKTPLGSYVLGDSIAFGLAEDALGDKLKALLMAPALISYDAGRSIVTPGMQIKKSALESVDIDRAHIAKSDVIIVVLGTNQIEYSFTDSQQQLMGKLKSIAPHAKYFWIDIGATFSNQAEGWSARNKSIYDNAPLLGYAVISRYKAIFGPDADPLRITPGLNFPGMQTEPGYGAPGNGHGASPELSRAILDAVASWATRCDRSN
jgi:hypothetical protein